MRNTLNWFEIPVTNMERARKFYETVFDIEMTDLDLGPDLQMSLFPGAEEEGVGGALCMHPDFYHRSSGSIGILKCQPKHG